MALDGEGPELERVGNRPASQLPVLLIAAAAVFVALALIKPWPAPNTSSSPSSHPRRTPPIATAATAPGSGGETVASGYFQQCFPTANWRLTAIQDDGSIAVRTVWPAAPSFAAVVPTSGSVRVYGSDVQGIGFCAPGDERAARVARVASVSLWRRDSSGQIVPVNGARVIDQALAGEGEVYLAPPDPLAADGAWPVGDYFFEIGLAREGSRVTWLSLQVLPTPVRAVAPSPRATAVPLI